MHCWQMKLFNSFKRGNINCIKNAIFCFPFGIPLLIFSPTEMIDLPSHIYIYIWWNIVIAYDLKESSGDRWCTPSPSWKLKNRKWQALSYNIKVYYNSISTILGCARNAPPKAALHS